MSENMYLTVNGRQRKVKSNSDVSLLLVLRNDLELNGPKFGCGLGQCGFCTVLMDGAPVRSCVTPLSEAQGKEITTLQGLSEGEELHPVQQAFLQERPGSGRETEVGPPTGHLKILLGRKRGSEAG